jgi:HEAT repeat protein
MHTPRSVRTLAFLTAPLLAGMAQLAGCGFTIEPDPAFTSGQQPAPGTAAARERSLRDESVQRLLSMTTSSNPQVRANAIEGLERAGPRAEPAIALALKDENPGVRSIAAIVAARSGLVSLAPTVRQLTVDPSEFVRAAALASLFILGEPVDPSELSTMVLSARDPRARAHAAFLLGEMGDASAVPMLRQAWSTPIRDASEIERRILRLQIAEALIKLGDDTSMDSVRAALFPSRPDELEATALAVQIIGEVRDRGSIDQLIYLADDSQSRVMPAEVRLAVAGALAKMGLDQGGFIADRYADNNAEVIRAQAAKVYGRTGRAEHVPALMAMMDDPSELVRVAAAAGMVDLLAGGDTADARQP